MVNIYSKHKLIQQVKKTVDKHALPYAVLESYPNKELKFSIDGNDPCYIYPTNKELRDISLELEAKQETHLVFVVDGDFALVEKGSVYDERILPTEEPEDELAALRREIEESHDDTEEAVMSGLQIRLVGVEELAPVQEIVKIEEVAEVTEPATESDDVKDEVLNSAGLPDGTDIDVLPEAIYKVADTNEEHKNEPEPSKSNFYKNPRNKKNNNGRK